MEFLSRGYEALCEERMFCFVYNLKLKYVNLFILFRVNIMDLFVNFYRFTRNKLIGCTVSSNKDFILNFHQLYLKLNQS